MFSLNSMLDSLRPGKLVSNLASNYSKLKQRISPALPITQLLPNLYHIDFPQQQHASQIAQHTAGSPYLLCNISEYTYDDQLSKELLLKNPRGKLEHLHFELYGSLPFCELIEAIQRVKEAVGQGWKVYVHCQEGRVRSAVFLASYFFMTGVGDISEAILQINKRLGIDLESASAGYKNQHTLFKNLVNYHTDKNFINKHRLQLQTITISHAPRISPSTASSPIDLGEVQVVVQVRCGSQVVHKSSYKEGVRQGDSVCLDLSKTSKKVVVSDDFLVVVKYLHKQSLYNVLRIQANTNFIFNCFTRVHQHDIDLSRYCLPQNEHIFIDLTFAQDSSLSKLAQISQPQPVLSQQKQPQSKPKQQNWDLLSGEGVGNSEREGEAHADQFQWMAEPGEIDEQELNSKIEQVIKSMTLKEEERDCDRQAELEEEEEDFDDYLGKLESQAQG